MAKVALKATTTDMLPIQAVGTYQGLKSPFVNGLVVLFNGAINSFVPAVPGATASATIPFPAPIFLCGDMTNGIVVSDGAQNMAYLTGIGNTGASWNTLPSLPLPLEGGTTSEPFAALSGDLANGLVAFDGFNLFSMTLGSAPFEWHMMTQPPAIGTLQYIAGDPTNGVLLVIAPTAGGPSVLYYSQGCSCNWVQVTASTPGLQLVKIKVEQVCGTGSGFVIYGENQLFTLVLKYTPSSATAPATCTAVATKFAPPPFAITNLTGDPVNGCTATCDTSGLIATTTAKFDFWTVINAQPPVQQQ